MTCSNLLHGTVLALMLLACVCRPALAEPAPRSINEIVALALKHSAELTALEQEATAQRSRAVQAGTFSNPTLELQGSTGSLTGSSEERSVSIGLNQEFPLNGKLRLRREVGQHESVTVQHQRDNAARLLKEEVSTLVLDYAMAAKRHSLARDLVNLNRELVQVAEERFKAGDIPELERNLAKVEQARAENYLLEVEREQTPLRIKIAVLTGLKEGEIQPLENTSRPGLTSNTQDLVQQALASRPDLLALTSERGKAETESRLASAEALPNLTAGLFAQWQRGSTELGGLSSTSSDTQLGLRLSMPIPLFDRNQGGRAAARARLDAADSRRVALERSISAEVEQSVARLASAERIVGLYQQGIIPQLAENLKLTQEAYRIGEVGILAVIDEQKKFFEVNDRYLSAMRDRQLALSALETAVATDFTGGAQ